MPSSRSEMCVVRLGSRRSIVVGLPVVVRRRYVPRTHAPSSRRRADAYVIAPIGASVDLGRRAGAHEQPHAVPVGDGPTGEAPVRDDDESVTADGERLPRHEHRLGV